MNSKGKTRKAPSEEEHDIQCTCVEWFRWQWPKYEPLLFAVPNGGGRSKSQGGKLKAEGVRRGVSDLLLLVPNKDYHGLCIEMKRPDKKSKQSEDQIEWQKEVEAQGYKYIVCRGLEGDFDKQVNEYLKNVQK